MVAFSSCFLWSIQIFQCLFVIWKILHHLYALLVDWAVNYIVSELYVAVQLVIHILLLFLFNRILYFVARESFAYSHAENLKKHKGVNRLLKVAVKYTVLIWFACMYTCGCVLNRIFWEGLWRRMVLLCWSSLFVLVWDIHSVLAQWHLANYFGLLSIWYALP